MTDFITNDRNVGECGLMTFEQLWSELCAQISVIPPIVNDSAPDREVTIHPGELPISSAAHNNLVDWRCVAIEKGGVSRCC